MALIGPAASGSESSRVLETPIPESRLKTLNIDRQLRKIDSTIRKSMTLDQKKVAEAVKSVEQILQKMLESNPRLTDAQLKKLKELLSDVKNLTYAAQKNAFSFYNIFHKSTSINARNEEKVKEKLSTITKMSENLEERVTPTLTAAQKAEFHKIVEENKAQADREREEAPPLLSKSLEAFTANEKAKLGKTRYEKALEEKQERESTMKLVIHEEPSSTEQPQLRGLEKNQLRPSNEMIAAAEKKAAEAKKKAETERAAKKAKEDAEKAAGTALKTAVPVSNTRPPSVPRWLTAEGQSPSKPSNTGNTGA